MATDKVQLSDLIQEIDCFITDVFECPLISKLNRVMVVYDGIYNYCTNDKDDSDKMTIKGKEIYEAIRQSYRKHISTLKFCSVSDLYTQFENIEAMRKVFYATFRYIDRFYAKYAYVETTDWIFLKNIFELVLKDHKDEISEMIFNEIQLCRKNAEGSSAKKLSQLINSIFFIYELENEHQEISNIQARYISTVNVLLNQKASPIGIVYNEILLAQIIFDKSICKILANKVFHSRLIEEFKSRLKNNMSMTDFGVTINYMINTHKSKFLEIYSTYITDQLDKKLDSNNIYAKDFFILVAKLNINFEQFQHTGITVLEFMGICYSLYAQLTKNSMIYFLPQLNTACQKWFENNYNRFENYTDVFNVAGYTITHNLEMQATVLFISVLVIKKDIAEQWFKATQIRLINYSHSRNRSKYLRHEKQFLNLLPCDTKSSMFRIIECFESPKIENIRYIFLLDPFTYYERIPVPELHTKIKIAIEHKLAKLNTSIPHYKLNILPNITNLIIKLNAALIRCDLIVYNIILILNDSSLNIDQLFRIVKMERYWFDRYIYLMKKESIIIQANDTLQLNIQLTGIINVFCFHSTSRTNFMSSTPIRSIAFANQAKIMRRMKVLKSIKLVDIKMHFGGIEDHERIIEELIVKEYLEKTDTQLMYIM